MAYEKERVQAKLNKWEGFLMNNPLPAWEELPGLELYMDQVIYLLNSYLSFLPEEEDGEKTITPAMINNYVKMKIIPPPVKKRYTRTHLAYLVMVCILKHTLNISLVQKMIPVELNEDEVRKVYTTFSQVHSRMSGYFVQQVRAASDPIFHRDGEKQVDELVLEVAAAANFSKLLTEKLIALQAGDWEPEKPEKPEAGSKRRKQQAESADGEKA